MPLKTIWWVAAGLVAALAVILSVLRLAAIAPIAAGLPELLLIAAVGLSPLVLAIAARTVSRGRAPGASTSLLLAAGIVLAGTGLLFAATDGFLGLRLASGDWRQLARATTATAPLGLVGVAAAWAVTAVGVARRERVWVRSSTGVLALTTLWFAASFAAASIWRVRAGTAWLTDATGLVTAVVIAVAGLLALGVPWVAGVTGTSGAQAPVTGADVDEPGPVEPVAESGWVDTQPHPRARIVAAGVAVVLVVGGAVALWTDRGDRLVVAEVFPDPALAGCVAQTMGVSDTGAKVSAADLADVLSLECPGPGLPGSAGPDTTTADPTAPDTATPDATSAPAAISDLSGLDRLTELSSLDVTGNAVTDLTPLAGLDLWGVVITDNPVSDLSPLAALATLTNLGASGTRVVDLSPLAGQNTLAYLGLRGTGINDIGPLASMGNLNEVDLGDNAITDVGPLAGHDHLTNVDLSGNAVTDLGALGPLPQLWTLDVSGNQIADLTSIPVFPTLTELWLGENPLTDVGPLTTLPVLTGVDVTGAGPSLPGIAELRAAGVYVGGLA
ncbi:leucine-rich repeat domain-containing protein [Occultella gossypii]|uniref:Leucine-rich repeat domain-containing protein n=1 Tax=Occultella gossypii TaxID=2800820 RepID=A0ABS7S3Y6_9MICO|nr:leucine-rich repeat domain-containing protein [Occultella gossypii]MBZ2195048.1 leucine-rich repeat domain-containing protein [Occultella gossypii]